MVSTPSLMDNSSMSPLDGATTFTDGLVSNTSLFNNVTVPPDNTYGLPHPLWLTIVLGTAASIVVVVTVLGNILVLMSFALERSIRQPTNYFIASLALSDLLIGTFSMPCFTIYLLMLLLCFCYSVCCTSWCCWCYCCVSAILYAALVDVVDAIVVFLLFCMLH